MLFKDFETRSENENLNEVESVKEAEGEFLSSTSEKLASKMAKLFEQGRKGDSDVTAVVSDSRDTHLILNGAHIDTEKDVLIAILADDIRVCGGIIGKKPIFISSSPQINGLQLIIDDHRNRFDRYFLAVAGKIVKVAVGEKQFLFKRIRIALYVRYSNGASFRLFDSLMNPFEQSEFCSGPNYEDMSVRTLALSYLTELFPELISSSKSAKSNELLKNEDNLDE
ncbi:hypothetical protein [Paenibacillus sp. HB172176]|uniref:hypothetical protein n=1 Tax=Paenibacillus sp. HB172176 TaxID=2493690 RepID=UPI00143ABB09|nr:hypothetical protein [Paenibacillus sp. HB172176]